MVAGIVLSSNADPFATGIEKIGYFLLGASVSLLGLLLVGAVQFWRVGVDTAEYSQQSLKVLRDQLSVSQQSLNQAQVPATSFAQALSDQVVDPPRFGLETKSNSSGGAKPADVKGAIDQLDARGGPTSFEQLADAPYVPKKIEERDGQYHFGKMSFSSRDAAEKYVEQLGVNPKYRS